MNNMKFSQKSEKGAVSIFIVIFTALLVSIVTASFIQVMLRNQQQASNNDLSQSAYDSALAGVEDAKRALVTLKACTNQPIIDPSCSNLRAALVSNGDDCMILGDPRIGVATFKDDKEVIVGDESLNQAYTCATVQVETESYEGTLQANESVLIPLDSVGPTNAITGVRISWFTRGDIPAVDDAGVAVTPRTPVMPPTPMSLLTKSAWRKNYPSLMRSQLIQFNEGDLNIEEFDVSGVANNNAKTLFLYPGTGGSATLDFASDTRRTAVSGSSPNLALCNNSFSLNVSYACSTRVAIPSIQPGTKQAYLQLTSQYNNATYKVELCNDITCGGGALNFDNVQPIVDSTGRASDLFRRIRARVALSESGMPSTYPEAALYLNKSLCKDFSITNDSFQDDTDTIPCSTEN